LTHPGQLHRGLVVMNISPGVRKSLAELFPYPAATHEPARGRFTSARARSAGRELALQNEMAVSK
jgi:hypothetical protein